MSDRFVSEVKLFNFTEIADGRGKLISLESNINIPFDVKRVYYLYSTKKEAARGFHAHIELKQMAICISGSCIIDVETVKGKTSFTMNCPNKGLFMDGIVWREIRNFSDDCVLLVLADAIYTEDDYIRDYDSFSLRLKSLT